MDLSQGLRTVAAASRPPVVPLSYLLDLADPAGHLDAFDERERFALHTTADWVLSFICGPHPTRSGSRCPYTPVSVMKERIWIGVEPDGASGGEEVLAESLLDLADRYLGEVSEEEPDNRYNVVLVALPGEPVYRVANQPDPPALRVEERLKPRFHAARRMIGVMDIVWDAAADTALRAPSPVDSPLGVVAMRHMIEGDDFFMRTPEALARYHAHFPPRAGGGEAPGRRR